MDLRFYDFDLNFLRQIPVSRSRWEIKFADIGNIEIDIPITNDFAPYIIAHIEDGIIVTQENFSGVLIGYDIDKEFKIYGRTLNWILTKRVIEKFAETTDSAATLISSWVETAFSDAPIFEIGNIPDSDVITISKTSDVLLSALVAEAAKMANIGFEVAADVQRKKWVFNFLTGQKRDFTPSAANKTAYDTRLTFDLLDFANCGYYTADDTRTYIPTDKTGLRRWETLLNGNTQSEAEEDLKNKTVKNDTSFNLRNFMFGVDYNLGDTLTLQIQKGQYKAVTEKKVAGIEINYDQNGKTEKPKME